MTVSLDARIDALAQAATDWQDPDYEPRAHAVEETLAADNRFTEEAIAFAVNQQMSLLEPDALAGWVEGQGTTTPQTVGVLHPGNVPLAGLQDVLAVLLTGHRYVGKVSSKSPALLPAFLREARQHAPDLPVTFAETAEALFEEADAVIATGSDETRTWAEQQCEAHGVSPDRRLLRGHRYSVAVIDGEETEEEREDLAVDALLHEGYGCRNVALIWAPSGMSPDPYFEAFAQFRGVFPAHPALPGSLQMQQAFLEATDQPHAYADGLEFLVSRGAPEPQRPGHIRWVEYDALDEVQAWLQAHEMEVQVIVARNEVAAALPDGLQYVAPGAAQRPPLDWQPDGVDTIAFLTALP